jgi:hypothetical protein
MAKLPADLKSLARAHTAMGIKVLAGIAQNGTSEAARVSAVALLFERGWGRPPQAHTDGGDDGDGRITVVITYGDREPQLIEQPALEHPSTIDLANGRDPERR